MWEFSRFDIIGFLAKLVAVSVQFKIGVLIADNLLNYVSLTNIHCDAKKLKINLIFLLCYQYLPHVNYRFQSVRLPLSKCR